MAAFMVILARSSQRSPGRRNRAASLCFPTGFELFRLGETRGAEDMVRVTKAAPHLSLAEVKSRMKTDQSAVSRQRWLIIYNALVEPRVASEIARHYGKKSKTAVTAVFSPKVG